MRLSRTITFVLIGILVAQSVFYYPNLPEFMASNFGGAGETNSWMQKSAFFVLEAVLLGFILAVFALIPLLIEKTPHSLVNLPKKDFWLAPERRAATIATIRNHFEWFAVFLILFFIAVNQLVFQANISGQKFHIRAFLLFLGAFFVFVIFWLVKFIGRFRTKI